MSELARKRLRQIEICLEEYGNLSLTPGITLSQRDFIATKVKELVKEKESLENNQDHWLAETKPKTTIVSDLVIKELEMAQQKANRQ